MGAAPAAAGRPRMAGEGKITGYETCNIVDRLKPFRVQS